MSTTWRLDMFGGMRLYGDDSTVAQFPTKRAGLILARLALSRNGSAGRDDLAETLWPEDYLDSTKVRLRQELKRLRDALGGASELVGGDRTWVRLDLEACIVDVRVFDRKWLAARAEVDPARRRQLLESAMEVCGGPLLPEYSEDWVISARQESRARQILARVELSAAMLDTGDTYAALETALGAVRQEPLHEPAVLALIRAYVAGGDSSGAQSAFQEYERASLKERREPSQQLRDALSEAGAHVGKSVPVATHEPAKVAVTAPSEPSPLPLPEYYDEYYGRDEEKHLLSELLSPESKVRLVTLVGPGGVGKSRLSVECVRQLGCPSAFVVADEEPHDGLHARLVALAEAVPNALVILDNVEPVVDIAASAVQRVLLAFPRIRILATSRQTLGLAGERHVPIEPLAAPPLLTAEAVENNVSVRLFLDRVRHTNPNYEPSAEELPYFTLLLQRLDGLPLAIELAAARVSSVGIRELADQADERFTWLVTKRRDLPARQRSLWAAIESSYSALDPDSAIALKKLSHFHGGFPTAVTTSVLGPHGMVLLEDLHDRSLIARAGQGRFRMLESIMEFARRQQTEEEVQVYSEIHAKAISGYLYPISRHAIGAGAGTKYDLIRADYENAVIASRWAAANDGFVAAELGAALWRYSAARGRPMVGAEIMKNLVGAPNLEDDVNTAELYFGIATCLRAAGQLEESATWFEKAIRVYEIVGEPSRIAWAKSNSASVALSQMRYADAERLIQEAMDGYYSTAGAYDRGMVITSLGTAQLRSGQVEKALITTEEALSLRISAGDPLEIARGYLALASVRHQAMVEVDRMDLMEKSVAAMRADLVQDFLLGALLDIAEAVTEEGGDPSPYLGEIDDLVLALKSPGSAAVAERLRAHLDLKEGDRAGANSRFARAISIAYNSGDRQRLAQVMLPALEFLSTGELEKVLPLYAHVRETYMPETPRERHRRLALGNPKPVKGTLDDLIRILLVTFATHK
jgi:DNA-binding SARP family transcriptional activator/tetratricopeptide (TPR) repeat protein